MLLFNKRLTRMLLIFSHSLNYCADALQALDRGCEGVPLSMHAVKIRKFVFGSNHPAYAHALSVLASCYHQVGRSFDALGLLEECLEICEKSFSKNHANMIPNLMLYGAVLSVMGNCEKARVAYTRALDIHNMNFTEEQNTHQLVKLQNALSSVCVKPQTKENAILCMPISFESSKTHVVVCADFGHRSSDEYMLCCASSLQRMGILKLVSVVAVSPPQVAQANIAREALDSLLLSNVPVAYGTSSMSESRTANDAMLSADNGAHSAHMSNTGAELLRQVLLKMPEKSLVIMCTACFDGVSEVIDTHRDLFASKVKEVVIIGSVKPVRKRVFIEPEDFGVDKEDAFAKNVYSACQELDIPTVTLFKNVARGFPFSSTLVDALALSNHMVSTKIQQAEEMHMNSVWEVIKQLKSETSYFSPNNVDIKRFHKYSLGGEPPTAGHQHNIWPSIKSINLELVFGLLCCISTYQNAHFRWESHQVKGTVHKVCRHSNSKVGIINAEALSNEIYMLIGFALRVSLANTSC
jgi:tetratricopeptide (TPR) repeat protein